MKRIATIATGAAVAVGLLTAAPAAAGPSQTVLHESFASAMDGYPAESATMTNHQFLSAGAEPYIRNGYLTTADPDAALAGSYRIAELGADVTRVGATFALSPYSAEGGVLCLSIQADSIARAASVPVSPMHFVIGPTRWSLDVNTEGGTSVENLASGTLDEPLVADGSTLHTIAVDLDRDASKVRLTLPDGTRRTFSNPAFGIAGEFVYVEPFKFPSGGPVAEMSNALVSEWWADTSRVVVLEEAEVVGVEQTTVSPPPMATEVTPTPPSPVVVAEPPAAVQSPTPTAVGVPRRVRATRDGRRVFVSWRTAVAAEAYAVRCGTRRVVVSGTRARLRSQGRSCSVRAVASASASPWVKVGIKLQR